MKYFVIFGLLSILVTIGFVQPVSSQMMCAGGDEVFHFTVNDIVFIGTVTAINPSNNTNRYDYIAFDVKYPVKGLGNVSDFTIATYHGGSYSYDFKINSEYLVHANERLGVKYFTDLCSANQLLKTDGDVEEMKNKLLEISMPPPLKQKQYGLASHAIKCKQSLVLIQKYDGSPACVYPETKQKLVDRGWTKPVCSDLILEHLYKYSNLFKDGYDGKFRIEDIGLSDGVTEKDLNNCVTETQETIQRLQDDSYEVSLKDAKFIEQLALQDPDVANFAKEIEWKSECCKDTFMVETQEYEISITFQRLDKDSHLRVIFDRDTLEILDVTNDRYIRHTPITPELEKSGTYELQKGNKTYDIPYHIQGGSDIKEIISDESNAIIIILEPYDSGSLEITLTRELVNAKISKDVDDLFFVFIDEAEVPYTEITTDATRTLTIQFEKDSKVIKILGAMPL